MSMVAGIPICRPPTAHMQMQMRYGSFYAGIWWKKSSPIFISDSYNSANIHEYEVPCTFCPFLYLNRGKQMSPEELDYCKQTHPERLNCWPHPGSPGISLWGQLLSQAPKNFENPSLIFKVSFLFYILFSCNF